MKSKTVVSYEIDDLELAAAELIKGINDGFELLANTCAIVFCDSDLDHDALLKLLKQKFQHDIIGCTCIASMDQKEGFHESSITLTVLTANDCTFATALSSPISPDNVEREIEQTYMQGLQSLGKTPSMVFSLPPYNLDIMLDTFTETFNKLAPNVPFVGGLPSYRSDNDVNKTILNSGSYEDRLVLLLIGGNVRPVFSIQSVTSSPVERKRKVTAASGNTVYKVVSQTFVEYLEDIGIPVEKMIEGNNTITFVSNPILLENVKRDDEGVYAFVRTLHKIDPATGSGTAIGLIPKDATLSICSLQAEQIEEAALAGVDEIMEKMAQEKDYEYSTVFAISCIGRYLLMVPQNGAEMEKVLSRLPANLSLGGFYSYGEISPIKSHSGGMINFAHNESLVLCAI